MAVGTGFEPVDVKDIDLLATSWVKPLPQPTIYVNLDTFLGLNN